MSNKESLYEISLGLLDFPATGAISVFVFADDIYEAIVSGVEWYLNATGNTLFSVTKAVKLTGLAYANVLPCKNCNMAVLYMEPPERHIHWNSSCLCENPEPIEGR